MDGKGMEATQMRHCLLASKECLANMCRVCPSLCVCSFLECVNGRWRHSSIVLCRSSPIHLVAFPACYRSLRFHVGMSLCGRFLHPLVGVSRARDDGNCIFGRLLALLAIETEFLFLWCFVFVPGAELARLTLFCDVHVLATWHSRRVHRTG